MNYCLYQDKAKNCFLVYNSQVQKITWENTCPPLEIDQMAANAFFIRVDEIIRTIPTDIEIYKVRPGNFLRVMDIDGKKNLVIGRKNIGEIIKEHDWNQLKDTGGVIISHVINTEKRIISILSASRSTQPSLKVPLNKNHMGTNLFLETQTEKDIEKSNEEYYEGIIKIPKTMVVSDDLAKRLLDADVQIYKRVSELTLKMDRVLDNSERKYQEQYFNQKLNEEKKINELTKTIDDLLKQNQSLLVERQYLNKLIDESKALALNKLKDELKFSRVALSRHIDLDQYTSSKESVEFMIKEIFSSILSEEELEIIKGDKAVVAIRNFCDGIDSKIQSLQEIKKEFVELKIIETGGER